MVGTLDVFYAHVRGGLLSHTPRWTGGLMGVNWLGLLGDLGALAF
ncbi:MAG: hypothetical protein QW680_09715 [Pyrobaculum sp.]